MAKYAPNLVKYINLNMEDVQQNLYRTNAVNVLCLGISYPNCRSPEIQGKY